MKDRRRTFICLRCWIPNSHQWPGVVIFLPQHQLSCACFGLQFRTHSWARLPWTEYKGHIAHNTKKLPTVWFFTQRRRTTAEDFFFVKLHNTVAVEDRILRPSPQQTTSNDLILHPVEVPHTHHRIYSCYFEANCQTQCGGQDNTEVRWGRQAEAVSEAMMI